MPLTSASFLVAQSAITASSQAIPFNPSLSRTSSVLQSLSSNAPVVGAAWVISSTIFTTYSTTLFLKYRKDLSVSENAAKATILPTIQPSRTSRTQPQFANRSSALLAQSLPRTTLLTFVRFAGSLAIGLFWNPNTFSKGRLAARVTEMIDLLPSFVLPAVLLFIANYTNSIALDRIGISLTYTSKCGIPLMTVLLTLLFEGRSALPNVYALLSLVPIAIGIACASWSAPNFEGLGFFAALVSTLSQSALNVASKQAISVTGVSGPTAQRPMVATGLILTLIVCALQHLFTTTKNQLVSSTTTTPTRNINSSMHDEKVTRTMKRKHRYSNAIDIPSHMSTSTTLPPIWLTVLAFVSYHVEYTLSFMFVKLVQPVTYGTLDAVRRLGIILAGRAMFSGAPLSNLNQCGIVVALLGAISYSLATSRNHN